MEFVVLSHRDSKDIFILGGTDDIQVLLDDSQVQKVDGGRGGSGEEKRGSETAFTKAIKELCVSKAYCTNEEIALQTRKPVLKGMQTV